MRNWLLVIGLSLSAVALAPLAVAAGVFEISTSGKGSLALLGGKPCLIDPPGRAEHRDWSVTTPARLGTTHIRVRGSLWAGMFLAADPEKGTVGLGGFAGERFPAGSEWRLTRVGTTDSWLVQATAGKYRGWYLDAEEKGEKRGAGAGANTVYRLKLSKRPGPHSRWQIIVIAP